MTQSSLTGGLGNKREVLRVGDSLRRPVGDHSPAVSPLLLAQLAMQGFLAPR
jgi:hypothetical protein